MTKKEKLSYFIPLFIALAIALTGFILGSFYDKSISEYYFDKNSLDVPAFSNVMCVVGPLITNFFGAFAATCVFFNAERKSKKATILLKILAVVTFIAISFLSWKTGSDFVDFLTDPTKTEILIFRLIVALIVVISDVIIVYFTHKNTKKLDSKTVFWTGLTMLLIIIAIAGSNEVIKYLASRPRPRLIFSSSEQYREWYQWRPLYGFQISESKSFISGHSSNSMSALTLLPLLISLTNLSKKSNWLVVSVSIGALMSLIIGISRLFALAHFLTDICGGFILSLIVQIVVLQIVYLIQRKTGDFTPVSRK